MLLGCAHWVYPRERGGTRSSASLRRAANGLSPRTRGNPSTCSAAAVGLRSIPANAGEPSTRVDDAPCHRVYPRERGGTVRRGSTTRSHPGLSPRTRGNRAPSASAIASYGSIPANAGEPAGGRTPSVRLRVYPRERGGTSGRYCHPIHCGGLSPRTRGNQAAADDRRQPAGSIPANAGEP